MSIPGTALFTALLVAWALGTLLVRAGWPRGRSGRQDLSLQLPLGMLVGLGVTSVTFFAASLCSNQPARLSAAFEVVAMVALVWLLVRRARPAASLAMSRPWTLWDLFLASVCAQVGVLAAVTAWRSYSAEPYGGWDAWAIWNMHARFMLRAGSSWPTLLDAAQLGWTHPDYPRLVPASVARVWAWGGVEAPEASASVSGLFAAASVWLLVAVVARLRGRMAGLLAGLVLLSTPFFVTFSSNQHADIPLASFMLAAVALAVLGDHWFLAGVCAGLAAWTKNEGLLFAGGFGAVTIWRLRGQANRAQVPWLAAGLLLGLLPVLVFKIALAPANDLISAPFGPRVLQIVDPGRHELIIASLLRDLRLFGEWHWLPYVALALPFAAWRLRGKLTGHEGLLPAILVLMLGGFYTVYLLTPQDLVWHLDTSLVRLLLQLWPIALLTWALTLPRLQLPAWFFPVPRWAFALVVFANVVAANRVLTSLSHQLAVDELAIGDKQGAMITAAVGSGWFGVERHSGERWAWSGGRATLRLRASSPAPDLRVTLRFDLRSLSPRTVVVRLGPRILWEGALSDQFLRVEIKDLPLTAELMALEFTTDTSGVPEAATAGARALAFAVYHLELR